MTDAVVLRGEDAAREVWQLCQELLAVPGLPASLRRAAADCAQRLDENPHGAYIHPALEDLAAVSAANRQTLDRAGNGPTLATNSGSRGSAANQEEAHPRDDTG